MHTQLTINRKKNSITNAWWVSNSPMLINMSWPVSFVVVVVGIFREFLQHFCRNRRKTPLTRSPKPSFDRYMLCCWWCYYYYYYSLYAQSMKTQGLLRVKFFSLYRNFCESEMENGRQRKRKRFAWSIEVVVIIPHGFIVATVLLFVVAAI